MLLQRSTSPRSLGPLFAFVGLFGGVGQLVGAGVAQAVLAIAGARAALIAVGLIIVVIAIASAGRLRTADANADIPVVEMSLLANVPMFLPLPAATPYEPFATAFQAAVGIDEALNLAIETRSGSLARLFPGSTSSHSEAQPVVARLELFDAVVTLVRRLSRAYPLLLVVDDLHWADAPTMLLLRHLIEHGGDQRLLILATCRDSDLDVSHPVRKMFADIRVSARATLVDLAVLTESEVAQMVSSLAPSAPFARIAAIAQSVHGESSGNPFFASELLRHLATSGQLDRALDAAAGDRLPIPGFRP